MFTVRYETTHTHLVIKGFAIKTENKQRMQNSNISFIPFHYALLFFCLSIRFLFWEFIVVRDVLLPALDMAKLQAAPKGRNNTLCSNGSLLGNSDLYTQVNSFQSSRLINFVDISILRIKIQHTAFRGLDRSPSSDRWKGV